jgi:L-cysteine S-thiosulfotransferase
MHSQCPPKRDARHKAGHDGVLVVALALIASLHADLSFAEVPLAERRSGYDTMSRDTKAMQDDDTANPATLAVLDGEALWTRKVGGKACADCHGDATTSMRGVSARYPAFDAGKGRPINLEQRINICRTDQQKATRLAFESKDLLALAAYVGRQSRGMPVEIAVDERTKPFLDAGRDMFTQRQGQLNLSCAQCHDDNSGGKLAGAPIPQGHATGYPLYRLEWQSLGSLQRRLRNCLFGMRAETYALGAPEYVDLELYLAWRARGMPVETPAVRP